MAEVLPSGCWISCHFPQCWVIFVRWFPRSIYGQWMRRSQPPDSIHMGGGAEANGLKARGLVDVKGENVVFNLMVLSVSRFSTSSPKTKSSSASGQENLPITILQKKDIKHKTSSQKEKPNLFLNPVINSQLVSNESIVQELSHGVSPQSQFILSHPSQCCAPNNIPPISRHHSQPITPSINAPLYRCLLACLSFYSRPVYQGKTKDSSRV